MHFAANWKYKRCQSQQDLSTYTEPERVLLLVVIVIVGHIIASNDVVVVVVVAVAHDVEFRETPLPGCCCCGF